MQKVYYLLIFSTLLLIGSCSGCDEDGCESGFLEFNLPVDVIGLKDTLNIGDTLRVKLEIPERMNERNSGIAYDFIDYQFLLINYMERLDTLPVDAYGTSKFNWVAQEGSISPLFSVYTISPVNRDGAYYYEVAIVPQKKGLYAYGMNSDIKRMNTLKKLDGPCAKNEVYVHPRLNNPEAANFDLLQLSPDPVYKALSRQRFDDSAAFCFYVQ